MINTLIKEQTFNSKWFERKGIVRVEIRREEPAGLSICVNIDDIQFDETLWDLPWKEAKMIYGKARVAADALIFQHCCVVADGEVWLISEETNDTITVSCKTAQHFCEGLRVKISKEGDIKQQIITAIETEPPF